MSQGNPTTDQITPGPWMVNKYGSIGAGQYGTLPIVAAVEPLEGPDRKYGDHGANARLIAAAPDLLASLKAVRDWMDNPELPICPLDVGMASAIRLAVAKAESRS